MEKRFAITKHGIYIKDLTGFRLIGIDAETYAQPGRLAARLRQIGIRVSEDDDGELYISRFELYRIPSRIREHSKLLTPATKKNGRYNVLASAWENIVIPRVETWFQYVEVQKKLGRAA